MSFFCLKLTIIVKHVQMTFRLDKRKNIYRKQSPYNSWLVTISLLGSKSYVLLTIKICGTSALTTFIQICLTAEPWWSWLPTCHGLLRAQNSINTVILQTKLISDKDSLHLLKTLVEEIIFLQNFNSQLSTFFRSEGFNFPIPSKNRFCWNNYDLIMSFD